MTTIDYTLLEKSCFMRVTDHPEKVYSVQLSELEDQRTMDNLLAYYSNVLKAKSMEVAATYFCSYYGYVITGWLDCFSRKQIALDVSLQNIELQIYKEKIHEYYGVTFRLLQTEEKPISMEESASNRGPMIERLFADQVVPLVKWFALSTAVRERDLWGQIALGLYYGYDKLLVLIESEEERVRLQEDFTYMTQLTEPQVFRLNKNPLDITFTMVESPNDPGTWMRMKPSCCLYYLTEGAQAKCYTCPRVSEQERERRRKEIQASS